MSEKKHHFTHRPVVTGPFDWDQAGEYTDILYHTGKAGTETAGIARITINRPEVRNAFRPLTVQEMQDAFAKARDEPSIGVIILTGAGPWPFVQEATSEFGEIMVIQKLILAPSD